LTAFSCTFSAATSTILGGMELIGKGGVGGTAERGGFVATVVSVLLAPVAGGGGGAD
jgi:hypothetical protein